MSYRQLAALGILLLLGTSQAFARQPWPPGLMVTLEAEQARIGAEEPVGILFTLTNTSRRTLQVLRWNTPLEGFHSDMFRVEKDGKPVPYTGKLVKRGTPEAEDYVTLAAGESASARVNLEEGYAILDAGEYSVRFDEAPFQALASRGRPWPAAKRSNGVLLQVIEPRTPPELPARAPGRLGEKSEFWYCSAAQQAEIVEALDKAVFIASLADLVLWITPPASQPTNVKYKTWFGAHTQARYDRVKLNFDKIFNALDVQNLVFDCSRNGCPGTAYAYVVPSRPYGINLCNKFWTAPLEGINSKAGTLVHEVSHFTIVAGTGDHTFGPASCQSLAITNPALAIANGDNYEYYAETISD